MRNKFTLIATFLIIALIFTSKAESTPSENTPSNNANSPVSEVKTSEEKGEESIDQLYKMFIMNNATMPSLVSFTNGITGYNKLKAEGKIKNELLTIVDFSLPSTEKRMWILDMTNQKVIFNTLVAHGKNTGNEYAERFSNTVNSLQSSLGFYITGETYQGGNGYSMFIDGMEEKFNSKARERYVVVHGAEYANPESIKNLGRLGRSYGCPALPTSVTKEIIDTIKNKSVLYIHSSNKNYTENSEMIKV